MSSIIVGDCREVLPTLPPSSVQCCITSPPYWGQRDYGGGAAELGQEPTPDCGTRPTLRGEKNSLLCGFCYICALVGVFREVHRVLAPDGVLWLNIADKIITGQHGNRHGHTGGLNPSSKRTQAWRGNRGNLPAAIPPGFQRRGLAGIPARAALALTADGWLQRGEVIWAKGVSGSRRFGKPLPDPAPDRPSRSHEHLLMFVKQPHYYFDAAGIGEPLVTREGNGTMHDVWHFNPQPFPGAHTATFPEHLVYPCVLSSSRPGDVVLDPFIGSGTTACVAAATERNYVGIDLHPQTAELVALRRKRAENRTTNAQTE